MLDVSSAGVVQVHKDGENFIGMSNIGENLSSSEARLQFFDGEAFLEFVPDVNFDREVEVGDSFCFKSSFLLCSQNDNCFIASCFQI